MSEINNIWKSLQGQLSEEETKSFQTWTASSDANRQEFLEVDKIWKQSEFLQDIFIVDDDKDWLEIEKRISATSKTRNLSIRWIGVAASFLLISSLVLWYFIQKGESLYKTITTQNEIVNLDLPDGSSIKLSEGSTLRYFTRMDEELDVRKVYVSGQATFDISADSLRPFIVETAKTGVQVLGTVFHIDQVDSSNVQVENIEGLIKFYELENEENAVILEQGEVFNYDGSGFSDISPKEIIIEDKGKDLRIEYIIDYLLKKFDGRFNTGPYGHFDLNSKIRVNLDQSLEDILLELENKAKIDYRKTCPNCYEIKSLTL